MIDYLIKNAFIYDGAGNEPFVGDIGIVGEWIAFIKRGRHTHMKAKREIDAEGLAASPGFIDVHCHSEFAILAHPEAESKIAQGVTTEINGNCGFSLSPIYKEAVGHKEKEFTKYNIKERWSSLGQYCKVLSEKRPAVNCGTLTGHGNIRGSVMGYDDRKPTSDTMEEMAALLSMEANDGSLGLSTGLIYSPGVFSDNNEIIDLINESHINNLIYATHMRSEGECLLESIGDTIEIAEKTGISIHISHLKTAGKGNWHKIDDVISLLQKAGDKGIRVTCDRYPYIASQTSLDAVLPAWVYEGGDAEEVRRLKNADTGMKIRGELSELKGEGDYWNSVMISSVKSTKNRFMEGMRISEIAGDRGLSPVDFVIDLLIEENLAVETIFFSMNEDNLRKILSLKGCMIGSDSSVRGFRGMDGKPHPRAFGSFPRFIGKYAIREGLMPLKEAIFKSTMLPALTFGIKNRGVLRDGNFADIVLFDVERIIDRAEYADPFRAPEGIEYVFVNGLPAMERGKLAGSRSGRVV